MKPLLEEIIEYQIIDWRARRPPSRAKKPAIIPSVAVAHSHGAGGAEVAALVAKKLGFRLYDRELVKLIADQAGVAEALSEALDEKVLSTIERHVVRLWREDDLNPEEHARHLVKAISTLSALGGVVIVGRCAGLFLDRATTVSVRLDAPFTLRSMRIADAEKLGDDEDRGRDRVLEVDGNRAAFAREHFRVDSADPLLYELLLNTARVGYEQAAETIVALVRARFPKVTFPLSP